MLKIKRVLISVSDKTGLDVLVKGIAAYGVEIVSTGGTARFISSLGINVRPVENLTGFPEMLDGRVKTLHPKIHGGLLYVRDNPKHQQQVKDASIEQIDMLVVNLYPFTKTVANPEAKLEDAIENIDIGGPSMIRSAAKNYKSVAVVTSPLQYDRILQEMSANNGSIPEGTLANLAVSAFKLTSEYDSAINDYLSHATNPGSQEKDSLFFPKNLVLKFDKIQDLRYGENQHQRAAFYKNPVDNEPCISNAKRLHGRELSMNNILDMDAALELVKEFEKPAACIIKHLNPCGVACADILSRAYTEALDCDRLSAFGGIVGLNRSVDVHTAEAILASDFIECIIAPSYEKDALTRLMVKQNLRILETGPLKNSISTGEMDLKKITGGILLQDTDTKDIDLSQLKIVTKKKPTPEEVDSLLFAWKVVKHVRSNAIVITCGTKTIGIGAGQMSRVDSVFMALHKAQKRSCGAVLASDAFFPKEDAVDIAAEAGITSIIQPGGSKADDKIIELADSKNLSMVFTGIRHFRH